MNQKDNDFPYDMENLGNLPMKSVPAQVHACIDGLTNIQKKVDDAIQKAAQAKTASKTAKNITLRWYKIGDKAKAIEALQDALVAVSDVQGDQSEAIRQLLAYQRDVAEGMKFLFALGAANMTANRTVVREVTMRLKNASEEEISEMARTELCAVVAQLKAQLDIQERQERLANDQKAVKANLKANQETVEELCVREEAQDRLLEEGARIDLRQDTELQRQAEKDAEHDRKISENREDIEILQKGMEEQGRIIEKYALSNHEQGAELKRQADRDTDHDEKIAENQKHIANNTRVIALIQKTLSKHQHEINEAKAARGISSDSRILSVISLIVSLVSMALVGYLFFH